MHAAGKNADPCIERKKRSRATKIQYEEKLNYKDIRKQNQTSKGECEAIKDKEKSIHGYLVVASTACLNLELRVS